MLFGVVQEHRKIMHRNIMQVLIVFICALFYKVFDAKTQWSKEAKVLFDFSKISSLRLCSFESNILVRTRVKIVLLIQDIDTASYYHLDKYFPLSCCRHRHLNKKLY